MRKLSTARVAVAFVILSCIGALVGCGSSSSGKLESIASEEQVNKIVEMRKYFDKVNGQWNSLTAEDKAAFTKLAGDDAKAQSMWKTMSTPMGSDRQG